MTKQKTINISLSEKEQKELDKLVAHYQKTSITNVSRSDVMKHLLKTGASTVFGQSQIR
ncbi:hypothetical protein [Priestia megaterium]|uniref:hypothetical protein n=1 Tax=Priestia megaterium TaxID=1404 RepID=UPI00363FAD6E